MLIDNISFSSRTTGEKDVRVEALGVERYQFNIPVIGELEGIFAQYDSVEVIMSTGIFILQENYYVEYYPKKGNRKQWNLRYHNIREEIEKEAFK